MYKAFYNLKRNPFEITPDPFFLFPTRRHNEALAALYYGVRRHKGFVVMTGEVGTGKTLLVRCLLQLLNQSDVAYAYVFNSRLSPVEFLQYVAGDFGLNVSGKNKSELLLVLSNYVISRHQKKLTTVLVVDEAHHVSAEVLEEIRLLTNLETTSEKLLQILLVGQPELDEKLDSIELRQLKQRIALRSQLQPLDLDETTGLHPAALAARRSKFQFLHAFSGRHDCKGASAFAWDSASDQYRVRKCADYCIRQAIPQRDARHHRGHRRRTSASVWCTNPKWTPPTVTRKATRGEQRKLCSSSMTICKNCNRARENREQPQPPEPLNMSRIFEALQRSESERSGAPLAPPALATELLQVVEREASAPAPKDFPANELAPQDFAEKELFARERLRRERLESIPVVASLPAAGQQADMSYRPGKSRRGEIPLSGRAFAAAPA